MANSPFSATSAFSRCNPISNFFNFSTKSSYSQLFFIKSSNSRPSRRPLFVKNVSGDQKQILKDLIPDEDTRTPSSLSPDSLSIASSIKYHEEFSPAFSPERFDLPKAYYATAKSIRDALIINWNATYEHCEKLNMKQAYYLSMEFLQGRALLNALGNLELTGPYAEALSKLGHGLESVARQIREAVEPQLMEKEEEKKKLRESSKESGGGSRARKSFSWFPRVHERLFAEISFR